MSDKESDPEEVSLSSSEDDDTGEALDIKPPQKQAGRKIDKKKHSDKQSKHADTKRHHADRHPDSRKGDRGHRQQYSDNRRDRDHPRPREEPRRRDVEDLRVRLDRGRIDAREKEKVSSDKERRHHEYEKDKRDRETSSRERYGSRDRDKAKQKEEVIVLTSRDREKHRSVEKEKHERDKEKHKEKEKEEEGSEAERLEQEKRRKRLLAAAMEREKMQKEVDARREQERKEKEKEKEREREREKEKEREREKEKEEKLKEKARQSKKKKAKPKRSKHTSKKTKKTRKRSETSIEEESTEDSSSSAASTSEEDSSSQSEETTSSDEESGTASSETSSSEESQEASSEEETIIKKKIEIIHESIEKRESTPVKRSRPTSPVTKRDEKRPRREERSPRAKKETKSPRRREERSPRAKEGDRTPEGRQREKDEEDEKMKDSASPEANAESPMDFREAEEDKMTPPPSPLPLKEELPPYLPAIMGCRSVEEFQCLNKIEEGTYGVVYRARDKRTNEIVALKRLKMEREKEGFPITSLREISTLLKAQHPNIVTVREIVVGSNMDKIFLVMDYVEHDIKALMETMKAKKQFFNMAEVKCLLLQLLAGVAHLHDNWIIHRDLKTSNLLLSHKGELKIGDFGLAREYGSPLKPYTSIVVTLWYRAPELLLGTKLYSTPIDVWSVGCIFGELVQMEPMFPGKSEVDEITRIFKDLGTPTEEVWKGYLKLPTVTKMSFPDFPPGNLRQRFSKLLGESGMDLLMKLLTYDPSKRITAEAALKHPFFRESPLPISKDMFPTWPAKSELGATRRAASPKPPSGGVDYKNLDNDDDVLAGRFYVGGAAAVPDRRPTQGGGFSLKF